MHTEESPNATPDLIFLPDSVIKIIEFNNHKMKNGLSSTAWLKEKSAAAILVRAHLFCHLPYRGLSRKGRFGPLFCHSGPVVKIHSKQGGGALCRHIPSVALLI